jgi:hypothetical protein
MAKGDEVAAVFEILEKVFNPEIEYEYDEALEELGLHTAKVRKTYPNLFKALQFPSKVLNLPTPIQAINANEDLMAKMAELIGKMNSNGQHAPAAQPVQAVSRTPMQQPQIVEDEVPVIPSTPYTQWAQNQAQVSTLNQEFYVKWDNDKVGPPGLFTTFALKRMDGSGKARFHVLEFVDDGTMHLKMVALTGNDG